MDTPPSSTHFPSLLLISLLCFLLLRHGGADLPLHQICGNTRNYTANSTYESNLRQLLPYLSSAASVSNGFSTSSTGESLDQASGLALCRGDINATDCHTCLGRASNDTQQLCPYDKTAVIWYENCLLKYSNQNFASVFNDSEEIAMYNVLNTTGGRFPGYTQNTTIYDFFNQVMNTLLSDVADSAASNSNSGMLFATGELSITSGFPTIYGLVQCNPDMSGPECRQCLQAQINETLNMFDGYQGGGILGVWCNLRYEVYPFYDRNPTIMLSSVAPGDLPGTPPGPPPPNTRPGSSPPLTVILPPQIPTASTWSRKNKFRIIIITTCLTVLLISCCLLRLLCIKRQRRAERAKLYNTRPTITFDTDEVIKLWKGKESNSNSPLFDFATIANSTNNFSIENKLGEGGFGPVYKGLLSDGLEIAVKRLSSRSGRDQTRGAILDWQKRFTIIEGIAQGLLYLHKHSQLRIIHRDLKVSNILLDSEMNPKISDFGLARIFGSNETQANTNRIVGTYGYMSPEYASEVKSDVFSFGVLLLEIVSGKRNASFHQYGNHFNLLGYAWEVWKEGKWFELIDPSLGGSSKTNEIVRCTHAALMCVQENAADRPTMSDVIAMLSIDNTNLPDPKQPAYFNVRIKDEAEMATNFIMPVSKNEITFTDLE
ncbi:Cysteine-rich receptor-like protein kinase 25, partial [Ananas comosus]